MKNFLKGILAITVLLVSFSFLANTSFAQGPAKQNTKKQEVQKMDEFQKKFAWWPTDALPAPVKDEVRGGYWWWPTKPGKAGPLWGNRGYCYVRKIIFDYKEEELPPPKAQEPRPALLIKKIIKNVKVYFDFDKADIRDDAASILEDAVEVLHRNPEADILITGNCDIRGTEQYNLKLGKQRGDAVKQFMLNKGIPESRIRIVSRGKLDAIAPVTDLVGMQKDRNAQFMIAEVQEIMVPYSGKVPEEAKPIEEGKFIEMKEEKVESQVMVSSKEYVIQKDDSLWKIAEREYRDGNQWRHIYEVNKDVIKNPNKLKAGTKIIIPIE